MMNTHYSMRTVMRRPDCFASEQALREAELRGSAWRAKCFGLIGAIAGALAGYWTLRRAGAVALLLGAWAGAMAGSRLADRIVYVALVIGVLCPIVFALVKAS